MREVPPWVEPSSANQTGAQVFASFLWWITGLAVLVFVWTLLAAAAWVLWHATWGGS